MAADTWHLKKGTPTYILMLYKHGVSSEREVGESCERGSNLQPCTTQTWLGDGTVVGRDHLCVVVGMHDYWCGTRVCILLIIF